MIKRVVSFILGVGLLAMCCVPGAAQEDRGYWRAASSAAVSITGDVAISPTKLMINFAYFPIVEARRLKPAEVSSVFDADVNAGIQGTLYRVNILAAKRFLHRNTLCGHEDTKWMATYVSGRSLQVAFFSGDQEPVFKFGAMQGSQALCGVFRYGR